MFNILNQLKFYIDSCKISHFLPKPKTYYFHADVSASSIFISSSSSLLNLRHTWSRGEWDNNIISTLAAHHTWESCSFIIFNHYYNIFGYDCGKPRWDFFEDSFWYVDKNGKFRSKSYKYRKLRCFVKFNNVLLWSPWLHHWCFLPNANIQLILILSLKWCEYGCNKNSHRDDF